MGEFVNPSLQNDALQCWQSCTHEVQATVRDYVLAKGDGELLFPRLPNQPDQLPTKSIVGFCEEVGIIA